MSYNSLHVPLDIGSWECELVPASEFFDGWSHRNRWNPFADRDTRKEMERQIEKDRQAFDQYFRPNYDFRRLIAADIDAIRSFVWDHLNFPHWDLPTTNMGIERALKQAVKDGKVVPIVNRDRRFPARTFRPTPAPLRWAPSSGAGGFTKSAYLFAAGTTSFNGEPVLSGPYDPASQAAQLAALRSASSDGDAGGFDWHGGADAVVAAALGVNVSSGDDDASNNTATQLGGAQPFEYTENARTTDTFDIAKTPNTGEPGSWYRNPGSGQMRLYGDGGHPVVDFDFDHDHGQGIPHAHNWAINPLTGKLRRGPGVPMSILP